MRYKNIREEELKNQVGRDFFSDYDYTKIISNIDFAVCVPGGTVYGDHYFLWAEAKAVRTDIYDMLTQLVLTVGKQMPTQTKKDILPPQFLGCFDNINIAFIPYDEIQEIFIISDFNWNVAPSDKTTKEFAKVREKIVDLFEGVGSHTVPYIFVFDNDETQLRNFINDNFVIGNVNINKTRIAKHNFIIIYNKWLEQVKPTIQIDDWEYAKQEGVLAGDFYLADLLSRDDVSLKDTLYVVLKKTQYELNRHTSRLGAFNKSEVIFKEGQEAHKRFWAIYERPPLEEYWEFMISRRDLLVPWDVRERKGSFFTPKKWVELSQQYIADVFGENWQSDYYIWDCAAGSGNLLMGLGEKYNIYASTIDKADVDAIHTLIDTNPFLLKENVFQFDFLNDDFDKLPPELYHIIKKTPEKLIIYINPPYAEGDAKIGRGRKGIHKSIVHEKYQTVLRKASSELFALFLMRIFKEIPGCKIGNFSTLKALCAPNFTIFREVFRAKLERLFIVPADTFDNVKGQFPIGFHIWDTSKKVRFNQIISDVYDAKGRGLEKKRIISYDGLRFISDWLEEHSHHSTSDYIGHLASVGNDFQHQNDVYIDDVNRKRIAGGRHTMISKGNLIVSSIFFACRHVIANDWQNDRDQFLYPHDNWVTDIEFKSDCLAFTLFHNANNIQSKYGTNHWIPFTEKEVNARKRFESHFMTDFMVGKSVRTAFMPSETIFNMGSDGINAVSTITFSTVAQNVFDAGRELWKYYHSQKDCNVNTSFYDIREYFQGRNEAGRMNSKSDDEMYNKLIGELRQAMKLLGEKIKPKVYEYGFLL